MSDGRALLAAICAHPDEVTPRLAYADWLDEFAGSMPAKKRESVRMRAELIRVQCELARLPSKEEDVETATRRVELEFRQEVLLKNASRRRAWAKPLTPPPAGCETLVEYLSHLPFWRGFPNFGGGEAEMLIAAGEAFFGLSPVRWLSCRNIHGELADRFLAQPWLLRVRRLFVSTNLDQSAWVDGPGGRAWRSSSDGTDAASTEKVFAAPPLANLEELELRNWEFRVSGAPVAVPALTSLRKLDLSGGIMRNPGAFARLADLLPAAVRLREFRLSGMRYDPGNLSDLAAVPQFGELQRLTLGSRFGATYPVPPFGAAGVRAVTTAPFWSTLRALHDDMRNTGFTAAEAEELAAAPPAPNLRTLWLPSGQLGRGVAALAASPVLAPVTSLDLSGTPFGDEGAIRLAKSPHLGRLLCLNVARCNIGPKGTKALAEAPWAANLVRLDVGGNSIRKEGIGALVAPENLPRLRRLDACWAAKNVGQKNRLRERYGDAVRF